MVPVGAYYEDNRIKGISHFIEHMCFKGTDKRKRGEIEFEIEKYGGDINAFTDYELTCYWARIANKYKDVAVDVITDLATNPIFPAKEIDKERQVIFQELNRYQDSPASYVGDLANTIYYPKENGFHLSIIGTKETLNRIDRDEMLRFYKANYATPTLIIVGDVKDSVHMDVDVSHEKCVAFSKPIRRKTLESRKDITQSSVLITGDVSPLQFSMNDTAFLTDLMEEVYNGMSGRLFAKIREEHNMVYGIHFNSYLYSDGTIHWEVSLGLDKNKINKAYKLIIEELSRPVTKKEMSIVVPKAIGSHYLTADSVCNIEETVAYSIRYGTSWQRYLNYEQNVKKYLPTLNEFIGQMNFGENILVGIVPKD
jgi:predicted Zn-dependent peptidase